MRSRLGLLVLLAIAGAAAWWLLFPGPPDEPATVVAVTVPELSPTAEAGSRLFEERCAVCHGPNADGSERGPPLVHRIYEPSHHADYAFMMAVRNGVRAHHWRFGDMAPVPGLNDDEIALVTQYVRELQRANGIR